MKGRILGWADDPGLSGWGHGCKVSWQGGDRRSIASIRCDNRTKSLGANENDYEPSTGSLTNEEGPGNSLSGPPVGTPPCWDLENFKLTGWHGFRCWVCGNWWQQLQKPQQQNFGRLPSWEGSKENGREAEGGLWVNGYSDALLLRTSDVRGSERLCPMKNSRCSFQCVLIVEHPGLGRGWIKILGTVITLPFKWSIHLHIGYNIIQEFATE